MKPRTFWAIILVLGAALGLCLWMWLTSDSGIASIPPKPIEEPVKHLASLSIPMPPPETEARPASAANLTDLPTTATPEAQVVVAMATATPAAPAPRAPEPTPPPAASADDTPNAVLTVSLDQAEHHVFKHGSGTYEVSITRFRRILVGPEQRPEEFVDMHVWQTSGVAPSTDMGLPFSAFGPEDQDYIRNWAQQQAAAAAAAAAAQATATPEQ